MIEKLGKNITAVAIIIVGVLIAGAVVFVNQEKAVSPSSETGFLSPEQAGEKAINFINENLLPEGTTASLVNITEESGIYKIQLKIEDQEYPSYVTKDGKFLFPEEGIDLGAPSAQEGVPKRDKSDVKLFIMSYCPYGLQAQKMFLPAYDLLKNEADMGIYFVNYIMHEKQEIDENLRQYCIQKEQKEKYYDYLNCFVKDGDFAGCLDKADIDKNEMDACISQTDQAYKITELYNDKSTWLSGSYPKFDVHADLNEKYAISGSPTIVINDTVVNVSQRSPEKFKEIVCQAFNTPPAECSQVLSEETLSPGFGLDTGSSSEGSCE